MISIIILSYNTQDLLKTCLQSIFSTIKNTEYEVIVVDNASSDGSVDLVKSSQFSVHSSRLKIVENDSNVGFAKGCNIGAKHAKGEYLLFLNSDTVLKSNDTLDKLLIHIQKEKVGIVGGMMVNPDNTYQRTFGSFYTLSHVAKMLFLGEKSEIATQDLKKVQKVDWVSGGFMMIRKSVFSEIKGFDERYFMYVEDVDLCYRVKKNGYDTVVDPSILITHVGHGSSNRTFAVVHIYQGLAIFYKQHKSSVEYFSLITLLKFKAWAVMFFATIKGDTQLADRYKKALVSL
jgi:GT2 family glycosyltransferase